ncbi:helix-turn-helix domain-containing protein [Clostridium gasigenes]|uniref:helix-turn-helix domain-containing protein n=1 Tax=Clostridium gasigenes TaxID=94869 RepID=UPI001C0E4DE9|nr:helix-turn-helix domain-containing protein [Clostridium gasigenes]MBU3107157.1 helix-turn-helix domain-containing protein [Clostridium gasigenes]
MNILSKEQSEMIDMMLEGVPMTNIAKKIGVHRSTLYVWKDLDYVRAELERRRRQLGKAARDKLINSVGDYVDNLIELANNSTDQRVKLQANKYLLDQAIGSPGTVKDDDKDIGKDVGGNKDILQKDLDSLKLKVIK